MAIKALSFATSVAFAIIAAGQAVAAPAAPAGQQLFTQKCAMCHTNKPGAPATVGPNLAGVIGRKAGSTTFSYSSAMKNSMVTWTKADLDRYLAGPTQMIPGVRMAVSVPDAQQRAAIVNYLATGH